MGSAELTIHGDPFDHFQRYCTVRRIVLALEPRDEAAGVAPGGPAGDAAAPAAPGAARVPRVLEIGANGHYNLLRYLPGFELVFSDIEAQPPAPVTFVRADATRLPFADGEFDYVVSMDVLEHVPRDRRPAFLAECARVAGRAAVVCCPIAAPGTARAEDDANAVFRLLSGSGYRWLDEHHDEGLPSADEVDAVLSGLGVPSARFGHGRVATWSALMRLHFMKEFEQPLRAAVTRADHLYNRFVFPADTGDECYREFWVFGTHAGRFDPARLSVDGTAQAALAEDLSGLFIELADAGELRLRAHRAELAKLHDSLSSTRRLLRRRQDELTASRQLDLERRSVISRHAAELHHLRHAYETSTSWRASAPLRSGARLVVKLQRFTRSGLAFVRSRGGPVGAARALVGMVRSQGAGRVLQRVRGLAAAPAGVPVVDAAEYRRWFTRREAAALERAGAELEALRRQGPLPTISVVMPTWNTPLEFLGRAIDSVAAQAYPAWELCIADDASGDRAVVEYLRQRAVLEPRIRLVLRERNGHIVAATNSALEAAVGEYACFLDHDDCLHPLALLRMAQAFAADPQLDVCYSDEDKLDRTGERCSPFFKPDWSPHLAGSQAYVGHLVCYRRALLGALGGLRAGTDGAQDFDLWLRASLVARRIGHVPEVLYHWREHETSTASGAAAKPYAHAAGAGALANWVAQRYPDAGIEIDDGEEVFTYRLRIPVPEDLSISIIIPTRDRVDLLAPCIDSILKRSSFDEVEILVLDNRSTEKQTADYLAALANSEPRVRVIPADMAFNWSRLNNLGARESRGDVLVFLNNDTEVLSPDWLERLAGYACLPDVGAVGGLLLFDDGTIQHSGVIVGLGGWADHVFRTMPPRHHVGPFVSPVLTRNALAVTGACLVVQRSKFESLGGFDEEFEICGSDVEFGLRAHARGLWNVMCAEARLVHYESKSRSPKVPDNDFRQSELKYRPYRTERVDPFFNPNLSLASTRPSLAEPASDA